MFKILFLARNTFFAQLAFGALLLLAVGVCAQGEDTRTLNGTNEPLRDPTQPLGYKTVVQAASSSRYTLNSVLISAQRKHAVINGVTLREGQVIPESGGVIVKRISPQTVVLQQGEKTWAIRLAPSVVIRH